MAQHTIVALYRSRAEAENAGRQLEAIGIPASDIALRSHQSTSTVAGSGGAEPERGHGFLDWLFGAEPPESDLERYRTHLEQEGGTALSIRADERDHDRIAGVLAGTDLVGIEGSDELGETALTPQAAPTEARGGAGEERVLPTAREELAIGKRHVADTRNYRIRRYVVERPAEASVALHDERVIVERRQPSGATEGGEPFEESEVEVTETREEPVIGKRVVAGEEVAVRKEARDRVETVRDKVRESRVEVDRAAAGNKPSGGGDPDAA
jgi:stress response protein YsnF